MNKRKNAGPRHNETRRKLDIGLYLGYMSGRYSPAREQNQHKLKKLAAKVCRPQTVTVHLTPSE